MPLWCALLLCCATSALAYALGHRRAVRQTAAWYRDVASWGTEERMRR